MGQMRVAYDVGHIGRTGNREGDLGARGGSIDEADCALIIAQSAWRASRKAHSPYLLTHSDYTERHSWAVRNGIRVYLAGHINAVDDKRVGVGKFFFHHETSKGNGDLLAALLAEEVSEVGTKLLGKPYECKAIESQPGDWTKNAHYTIKKFGKSVRGIGVCCEPFFISNPKHRRVFCQPAALTQIGQAYHRAITRWANERRTA